MAWSSSPLARPVTRLPTEDLTPPLLSIVIVSLNGASVLPQLLTSLSRLDYPRERLDVIVVNNGSSDATAALLNEWCARATPSSALSDDPGEHPPAAGARDAAAPQPDLSALAIALRVIHLATNHGFAGGNNEGIRIALGDWIVLLNDDTEVDPSWARDLMSVANTHAAAGILGTLLLYPDRRTVQHAGGSVERNGLTKHIGLNEIDTGQFNDVRPCDYVTGAALAVRRDVLQCIGLLDPNYWPIYFEEVDLCWRARRAGFEILQTPARATHYESRTTVAYSHGFLSKYHRNRLRFVALNFSAAQLLRWPLAELRWLRISWRHRPLRLLAAIYIRSLVRLPKWLWVRWTRDRDVQKHRQKQ